MIDFNLFATRLKSLRLIHKLTLQQLGEAIDSTKATIGNLENCNKQPSLLMVVALANYFDVSLDYLVGRTDNPDSHKR